MTSSHAKNFIDKWHRIFEENDPGLMLPLIHDDIEFYSPAVFQPKHGKKIVFETLERVFGIFKDYRVTDTWVKENEVLFEFETTVGKFTLQGVDRFVLDEHGKIVEMKVWIRPLTGLKELARTVANAEIEEYLAPKSRQQKMITRAQIRTSKLISSIKEGLRYR
ncbi:MAG: nuclear transport factor 2 family protein [bacterium]|nr:nuclear transport factor 2 family protein [bacterium]